MNRLAKGSMWAAVAALVVTLGVLVGAETARATTGEDDNNDVHNSCAYDGYTYFDTATFTWGIYTLYAVSSSGSNCATYRICNGYYWDPAISDFRNVISAWVNISDSYEAFCLYGVAATTNAYGYHQVRQPSTSYSNTIETHAQP